MSPIRSRAITCLLAIVAQIATPGLVLCQEIDGRVQIEFARDGCCSTESVDADAMRSADRGARTAAESPRTYVAPTSSETPGCVCAQDTSLSPLVTRPRPALIDQADLNPGLPDESRPGLLPHDGVALPPAPHRPHPLRCSGVLAALRTIVLRN